MARRVVHLEEHIEVSQDILLDHAKVAYKLSSTMAHYALANDGSGLDVKRGEQRGRTIPLIVLKELLVGNGVFKIGQSFKVMRKTKHMR
jgi:hypothetical protein